MELLQVALFGHSIYNNPEADARLAELVDTLTREHEFVEFYIGRHGDFDIAAASTVKRVRANHGLDNASMTLVLPYHTANDAYYADYYDDLAYPLSSRTHFKAAITKRNEWMVEQADLVIVLVERESGGAYTAMRYAERLGKRIINLVEPM